MSRQVKALQEWHGVSIRRRSVKVLEKSTLFCTFRNRIESRKKQKRLSSQGALCQDRPCFGGPVRFRGRRFSAFRLLSFFVSFSWQAEQQAHQETIAEHGEMMEKHQVQGWRGFLFQSTLNLLLFFILGTLLHNEFFVIFQYSTRLFFDIKLVLQDALVPYFLRLKKQLAMARYFSAFAFLPFAHSSAEVSIRSLRSKDARILGDMEDGWTWWTEWQVTWVTWKPHTHTHTPSQQSCSGPLRSTGPRTTCSRQSRSPPFQFLTTEEWLQLRTFSAFFWGRCNDLKYFCLFLDAFSLLWLARLDKKRDRHVEDVYKLRRKTVAPQWNWRSHVIHASLIWFYHVFPFAKVFSKQLHFCDASQAETGEVLNFFRGVIKTGM